ncbi:hypothetical protein HZY97_16100 [Sphingomonas sp. R-74633]|uniref:hypothetical protein n=1 Tax=Sphingomonas sp. R-74633 TaxID=2751188 RepID=UPI0015D202F4|nr:hypothetical protein [Sphingomonas sp. R-74633]NYT42295.1 hypothetical protein [Sphingomonas sp. R-74633]
MTRAPLASDFPWRSPLSVRPPDYSVPELDILVEVEGELARRNAPTGYARLIEKATMTEAAAAGRIAALSAIRDDLMARTWMLRHNIAVASGITPPAEPKREGPNRTWDAKVAEIRTELNIKRGSLPKYAASPTNPMTEDAARRILECWDALHALYWVYFAGWSDSEEGRIAMIADREAARARGPEWRDQAGEGGAVDPGQDWAGMAHLARRLSSGAQVLDVVAPATLRRFHRTAANRVILALEASQKTQAGTELRAKLEAELIVAQLERWIGRLDRLWGPREPLNPMEIAA